MRSPPSLERPAVAPDMCLLRIDPLARPHSVLIHCAVCCVCTALTVCGTHLSLCGALFGTILESAAASLCLNTLLCTTVPFVCGTHWRLFVVLSVHRNHHWHNAGECSGITKFPNCVQLCAAPVRSLFAALIGTMPESAPASLLDSLARPHSVLIHCYTVCCVCAALMCRMVVCGTHWHDAGECSGFTKFQTVSNSEN